MIKDKLDRQQEVELKRQLAVEKSLSAVHGIIFDQSDGSVEETNYLTALVAWKLMESALGPFHSAMLKYDMGQRDNEEKVQG